MSTITVTNGHELESQISTHLSKGFQLVSRSANSAQLQKSKKFSVVFALVALFAFAIPFVIYCVWFALQPASQVVSIKVI